MEAGEVITHRVACISPQAAVTVQRHSGNTAVEFSFFHSRET
jgi:hypothetical protein